VILLFFAPNHHGKFHPRKYPFFDQQSSDASPNTIDPTFDFTRLLQIHRSKPDRSFIVFDQKASGLFPRS